MSIANMFAKKMEQAMDNLSANEWAVTQVRENIVQSLTPSEAFENIVGVLNLAAEQNDIYAFSSSCWLAMDLVKLSGTTERPDGFEGALSRALVISKRLGCERDLEPVLKWYRYGT